MRCKSLEGYSTTKDIYIVKAHRFNDHEKCYVVGVYTTKTKARNAATREQECRGGKYICSIDVYAIDGERGSAFLKILDHIGGIA